MMKARLAAFGVAAILASAGAAHAAAVSPPQEPRVAPATHGTPADGRHEVAAQKIGTHPVHATGIGAIPDDDAAPAATNGVVAAAGIVPPPVPEHVRTAERALKSGSPLHSYLLSAGEYVLKVGTLSEQHTAPSRMSDVPLPGAIWLFGSALLAFLGISSRRKF